MILQAGLTRNIRNLYWYEEADYFAFFPRSHLLGSDDEKMDFIGMVIFMYVIIYLCNYCEVINYMKYFIC